MARDGDGSVDDGADPHDLMRFVAAQAPVYDAVRAELGRGRKESHWMWFIFPQMKALGRSSTALRFGIASRAEALACLEHPLLGARLVECTRLMLAAPTGRAATEILGPVDALKFRSSMTLFAALADTESPFAAALARFYDGADEATLALLDGG